jgi:sugar phosphate isomerase/epimerase
MEISRKEFLQVAAGAATAAAIGASGVKAASTGKPKRGVSIYSYSGVLYVDTTLEDCLVDMNSMDARGIEILANAHIEDYPSPSEAWVKNWHALCAKYNIVPVEYGHWVDSRMHPGRELTTKESYDSLVRDLKLANKLGFTVARTKLGVIDDTLTPVKNWREFIKMAIPEAQKLNVRMCPEIHSPTRLKSKMLDDYVDFIVKEKTTPWFGLNIDFGVFMNKPTAAMQAQTKSMGGRITAGDKPEDIVPLLPYVHACHAKFVNMSDDFVETTTPYDEIIALLIKHSWDGYMLSEYEGSNKDVPGYASDQLRKQHVMMKRLLGEA